MLKRKLCKVFFKTNTTMDHSKPIRVKNVYPSGENAFKKKLNAAA